MIIPIRNIDIRMSIDEDICGKVKLTEACSSFLTTSDDTAIVITSFTIPSNFILLSVTDNERTLIVHGQAPTIDIVDENLKLAK